MVQLAAVQHCAAFIGSLAKRCAREAGPGSPQAASASSYPAVSMPRPVSPSQAGPGGSGTLSTQAHYDVSLQRNTFQGGPKRLKSATSLCTAASTVPSLTAPMPLMLVRLLRATSMSLLDVQCSVRVGPADELSVLLGACVSDAGRLCSVQSLLCKLNNCTFFEIWDVEGRWSVKQKHVAAMDDLTAEVRVCL